MTRRFYRFIRAFPYTVMGIIPPNRPCPAARHRPGQIRPTVTMRPDVHDDHVGFGSGRVRCLQHRGSRTAFGQTVFLGTSPGRSERTDRKFAVRLIAAWLTQDIMRPRSISPLAGIAICSCITCRRRHPLCRNGWRLQSTEAYNLRLSLRSSFETSPGREAPGIRRSSPDATIPSG
jgi:hypothetical protein